MYCCSVFFVIFGFTFTVLWTAIFVYLRGLTGSHKFFNLFPVCFFLDFRVCLMSLEDVQGWGLEPVAHLCQALREILTPHVLVVGARYVLGL